MSIPTPRLWSWRDACVRANLTPAIAGPFLAGRLALTLRVALYTVLGVALLRPAVTSPARTAPTFINQELP